jgi:Flp pilus assembly protein TadB
VSRERARRRAEREREAARRRAERERVERRASRRRAAATAVRERLPRRTRWRRQQGLLARRRRVQNGLVLAVVAASQLVVWLLVSDPWVRGASLVLAAATVPLIITVVFDRRS